VGEEELDAVLRAVSGATKRDGAALVSFDERSHAELPGRARFGRIHLGDDGREATLEIAEGVGAHARKPEPRLDQPGEIIAETAAPGELDVAVAIDLA